MICIKEIFVHWPERNSLKAGVAYTRSGVFTKKWAGKPYSYAADLETTDDEETGGVRIWSWQVATIHTSEQYPRTGYWGTTWDEFFEFIGAHDNAGSLDLWFFNLRFDGEFILDELFRRGYELCRPDSEDVRKKAAPPPGHFKTLISNGSWYRFEFTTPDGVRVSVTDAAKKYPGQTLKSLAVANGLEEGKGEIDYDKYRPVGYMPNLLEVDYIRRDVWILGQVLEHSFDAGLKRMTAAGDAKHQFFTILKSSVAQKAIEDKVRAPLSPVEDRAVRRAYRGGWTYAHPDKTGYHVGPGRVYDVNSLYPSVMYDHVYPIAAFVRDGTAIQSKERRQWLTSDGDLANAVSVFSRRSDDYLFIGQFRVKADLRSGGVACFGSKPGMYAAAVYSSHLDDLFWLTSVDLRLMMDMYEGSFEPVRMMVYSNLRRDLFNEYIDHWMAEKEAATVEGNKPRRQIAKLMLNSLYGKFGASATTLSNIPRFIDGALNLSEKVEDSGSPMFLPIAAFVTAYARDVTVRAAAACGDRFCYADTDSIHVVGDYPVPGLDVHETRLGAWKHESSFTDAVFCRAKQYCELSPEGELDVKVAGMPREMKSYVRMDDFITGRRFDDGKLRPTHVRGGVRLVPTGFDLKPAGEE